MPEVELTLSQQAALTALATSAGFTPAADEAYASVLKSISSNRETRISPVAGIVRVNWLEPH